MKRFFLALFAILLIVLSALFYDVLSVKAISVYDGAYRSTTDAYIKTICGTEQVGFDYLALLRDVDNYHVPAEHAQFMLDEQSKTAWFVSFQDWDSGGDRDLIYGTSNDFLPELVWNEQYVQATGLSGYATLSLGCVGNEPTFSASYLTPNQMTISNDGFTTPNYSVMNYFTYGFKLNYPAGYEGSLIPDMPVDPEQAQIIRPEYTWKVSKDGVLTVQYLKNITPFLTGSNFWVINQTTEDWASTGAELHNVTVQPAGSFNETFTLPGEGYYLFRIDHNQQLDSPPWPQAITGSRQVKQVWVEFYWDGESVVTGTTVGCTADVCNDLKNINGSHFFGADLDDHGLTAFITAPLSFIQGLSSAECEPLTLPFIQGKSIVLPCLKPFYQEHANALLLIWQTVITGVVAYLVAINSFARIKAISSPKDDSIEVYKL